MSRDITESDWKVWKTLRLRCIDKYCTETFAQVQQLSKNTDPVHDRHRALYQLVMKRDRQIEELFDPLTRSRAIMQIVNLYRSGLVSDEELRLFSEPLQSFFDQTKVL